MSRAKGRFSPRLPFEKEEILLEKQNLSQQTARRLYNLIAAEKRLLPGEKLPNEVELSRELGLSDSGRVQLIDHLTTIRPRWGTEGFALGVQLGVRLTAPIMKET